MEQGQQPEHPLVERVEETAARHGMWLPGERLVVGVSGGPDSVVLLHLLTQLARRHRLALVVAHLHHGLRGADADEDARFVKELAGSWSLPAVVEARDVAALAREAGVSLQVAAREARYEFFRRVAEAHGAHRIALGHHADDQAETVLFRILRGAGTRGLAGIPYVRGRIIRPLLDVWRAEILAYAEQHGLAYRTDLSNVDLRYRRNRIRHELIPYLEAHYSPRLRERLVRLAGLLREEEEFLEMTSLQTYRSLAQESGSQEGGEEGALRVILPRPGLAGLHPALARRVLRTALTRLRIPGNALDYTMVERILSLVRQDQGPLRFDGAGGLRVSLAGDELVLTRRSGSAAAGPGQEGFDFPVRVPGTYRLGHPPREVRLWRLSEADHFRGELASLSREQPLPSPGWEAVMDWDRVKPPLRLRTRRAGDRFQPLGMSGSKKLQDFLVDCKVERSQRDQIPLLVDQEGIICVLGYRIDERVRIGPQTKNLLKVTLRSISSDEGENDGDSHETSGVL